MILPKCSPAFIAAKASRRLFDLIDLVHHWLDLMQGDGLVHSFEHVARAHRYPLQADPGSKQDGHLDRLLEARQYADHGDMAADAYGLQPLLEGLRPADLHDEIAAHAGPLQHRAVARLQARIHE
ncbi:MAG TPA: hypothetical protein VGI79_06165 [Caulobacteraceae bacterium]|jgi:hypothetical protein